MSPQSSTNGVRIRHLLHNTLLSFIISIQTTAQIRQQGPASLPPLQNPTFFPFPSSTISILDSLRSLKLGSFVVMMGDHTVMSSEDSSAYPDEEDEFGLELRLGLSLPAAYDPCFSRISMARDFSPTVSIESSSSASSSTSSLSGNKRPAEHEPEGSSPPRRAAVRQVIGWPPVRTHRINNLGSHMKQVAAEGTVMIHSSDFSSNAIDSKDGKLSKTSFFVKVNMDGIPIGRKIDLNAHSCYETLSLTLDQMFRVAAGASATRINVDGKVVMTGPCFSLTYEDKEGDWMLVGDVPWEVFLKSVKRLRIRRSTKANCQAY